MDDVNVEYDLEKSENVQIKTHNEDVGEEL